MALQALLVPPVERNLYSVPAAQAALDNHVSAVAFLAKGLSALAESQGDGIGHRVIVSVCAAIDRGITDIFGRFVSAPRLEGGHEPVVRITVRREKRRVKVLSILAMPQQQDGEAQA
jgi:hypothetical protein